MKINSPLTSKNEVLPLVEAGADSFYAGVNFSKLFGNRILSSRWHCSNAEFQSEEEILEATKLVKDNNKEIYLTVNEHNYKPEHMELVADFVVKHSKKFTGFIVSSLPLILKIDKRAELVASTGLRITNHKAVKFYKDLGLKKIILP
ncbi:MAG: U32 family peptidase, partial [Nanoarchaeota archaeon]